MIRNPPHATVIITITIRIATTKINHNLNLILLLSGHRTEQNQELLNYYDVTGRLQYIILSQMDNLPVSFCFANLAKYIDLKVVGGKMMLLR